MHQHTVFTVHVEKAIKHPGRLAPQQLKVRQNQGNLPWVQGESKGLGLRRDGEPILQVGSRYILFLSSVTASPRLKEIGYFSATIDGVTGRSGELDELMLSFSGTWSQILIKSGLTSVPQEQGRSSFPDWKFSMGPEKKLTGLKEKDAIALIEKVLREAPDRIKN